MSEVGKPALPHSGARPWILHVDLDQFLAAVEVLRRPELAGRPVVVGGDGDPTRPRQVVATASYEARAFGVRSGMPLGQALRRCPDAVFLPSDHPAYDAASDEVMATLRSFPLAGRGVGLGRGVHRRRRPTTRRRSPREIKAARARARPALSCAIGIGETRLQAKTATGFAKPGRRRPPHPSRRGSPTMGERPVTAIWGIGARTADRLGELGIAHRRGARPRRPRRAGPPLRPDDRAAPAHPRARRRRLARSSTSRGSPSRGSKEETFTRDVAGADAIAAHVDRLAREVTAEVVAAGRRVTHVAVKVRTASFWTRTEDRQAPRWPDDRPGRGRGDGRRSCSTASSSVRPVRLLGVRVVLAPPG